MHKKLSCRQQTRNAFVQTLKHTHPHMCYHAEFGRSVLKDVCINRKEPQNWAALGTRPLAVGRRWPGRNMLLPLLLPNLFVLGQTLRELLRRSAWKKWPLASHLSRSLKVIGTDTTQEKFAVNAWPSWVDARRQYILLVIIVIIITIIINILLRLRVKKDVWWYLQPPGNSTRPWRADGRTDGRTDGHRPTAKTALTHSVAR